MRLVLLGAPGSGKGTQGARLGIRLGAPHIATGVLLRKVIVEAPESSLGRAARVIESGGMVSDETANALAFDALNRLDTGRGFVLDGYPRTFSQAIALDDYIAKRYGGVTVDTAVALNLSEAEAVRRLGRRRVCAKCGWSGVVDQLRVDPLGKTGFCPICDSPVSPRVDDDSEGILERLRLYRERTGSLREHYRSRGVLREVDGDGEIDDVFVRVCAALSISV